MAEIKSPGLQQPASPFVPLAGQFSRRLRALREKRGWSTRRLERETGIPRSILNRYENLPEPNPPLAHLIELERVFNLGSLEELFADVGLVLTYPSRLAIEVWQMSDDQKSPARGKRGAGP